MKIKEIIEKNKDYDEKVSICLKDPKDPYDPMSKQIFCGMLEDVPEEFREYEVIDTGWLLGAQMYEISCYIPEETSLRKYVVAIWRKGANVAELKDYLAAGPEVLFNKIADEEWNVPFPDAESISVCDEKGIILYKKEYEFPDEKIQTKKDPSPVDVIKEIAHSKVHLNEISGFLKKMEGCIENLFNGYICISDSWRYEYVKGKISMLQEVLPKFYGFELEYRTAIYPQSLVYLKVQKEIKRLEDLYLPFPDEDNPFQYGKMETQIEYLQMLRYLIDDGEYNSHWFDPVSDLVYE